MDWSAIAFILSVVTLVNGGFVWAVKSLLQNDRKKFIEEMAQVQACAARQSERQERLQDNLANLREQMPREYVRREDWIMGFSRIEQKIDAIWEYIHKTAMGGDGNGY